MLKILHFADLHIGCPFRRFAGKGKELREGTKKTLSSIVSTAKDENVDLVISSGDIGDSNRIAPGTVNFIVDELKKLDMPVVILAGNHDCLDKSSLYLRKKWGELDNVYIFNEDSSTFLFRNLSIAVHGKPNIAKTSPVSPLKGLAPSSDVKWNIAVAHGSLQIEGKSAADDHPITFDDIAGSQMDYIALGHWHNFYQLPYQGVTACYAGAASTASFSHCDSGTVNLVEFSDAGIEVRRIPVSYYKWKRIECTVKDISTILVSNAGPQSLLNVKVTEKIRPDDIETLNKYISEYQDKYYWLNIDYNEYGSKEIKIDSYKYPETTFLGQFLKITQEKIDSADPREKTFLEKALKEGYKITVTGEVD